MFIFRIYAHLRVLKILYHYDLMLRIRFRQRRYCLDSYYQSVKRYFCYFCRFNSLITRFLKENALNKFSHCSSIHL